MSFAIVAVRKFRGDTMVFIDSAVVSLPMRTLMSRVEKLRSITQSSNVNVNDVNSN